MKKDVTDEYGDLINPPSVTDEYEDPIPPIQLPRRQEPLQMPEPVIRDWTVHPPSPDPKIFIFKKILVPGMIFCLLILMLFMGQSLIPRLEQSSETYKNSVGMEFVPIPAGAFMMGSLSNEDGRESDESPIHKVTIKNSYYLGKYEVTQRQWYEVMGSRGGASNSYSDRNRPQCGVTWDDAQEFIKKLNEIERTDKYRLPSEAEWEYACRAGTSTKYFFGDNESKLEDYAWYDENILDEIVGLQKVGQKKSNPWGLYDMYGNVNEWVQDEWHNNYTGAPSDGSSWENGENPPYRVIRGGCFASGSPDHCRSAERNMYYSSSGSLSFYGFRVLKEI